ncbi:hypothetical protein [Streptomyces sp. RFCAC02]|uniref:hypothetical protein n=1 Tax=Streptomyces sp. RFCAC02 TaxID=2499143 RepID=UPI0010229D0A|nr:hypothetical protein [Streptomyces sp. RFCAC02]
MPGAGGRSTADSGDGSRSGAAPVVMGCLLPLLAVLVGAVSLAVHYAVREPVSPYRVEFSDPGTECRDGGSDEDAALTIDRETGEVLYCSVLPPVGPGPGRARAVGAFSAEEVARVTELTRSLATGGGLGAEDRRAVERLAGEIGREHGFERTSRTTLERVTWSVGLYGLIGGFAVLIAFGVLAHHLERQPGH